MATEQTTLIEATIGGGTFTIEGINLRTLMSDKIGSISPGCCYITSSYNGKEIYHCFGATVFVDDNSLYITSEDVSKAKEGLEKVLGSPLIPWSQSRYHQP